MFPRIMTIYSIPIYSYGTAIAIGLISYILLLHRDKRVGQYINHESVDTILFTVIIASAIGGKLLDSINALLEYNVITWTHMYTAILSGGFSILGSVIAGFISGIYQAYRLQLPIIKTADLFTLYLPIVHAFGRLGCFLAGCCYGNVTNCPVHIVYTNLDSYAPLGIPLHPVQLYAVAWHMISFIILYSMYRYIQASSGIIVGSYICSFALARGILELLRADYTPTVYGLSSAQWITCFLVCIGLLIIIYARYYDKNS